MGVYIKSMEMPKSCAECKMYVEDIYCCHLLQREIENPWADDGVELDCPLLPVPPHGRLIDADALDAGLKEMSEIEWNQKAAPVSWAYAFDAFRDIIERDEPTIIPAEPAEEGET